MNHKIEIIYMILFSFVFILFIDKCNFVDVPLAKSSISPDSTVSVTIAKWYDNHTAAISVDNDDNVLSEGQMKAQKFLMKNGMSMDYEMVTSQWNKDPAKIKYFVDSLFKHGFGYFGHGNLHINHDSLSYAQDLIDFKKCYNSIKNYGLKPVAYAYPGGFGNHFTTQQALHDAGFLCGRKFEKLDFKDPYIVPGDQKEPKNWYALPTLIMQSIDYDGCVICVNNTQDLIPYLDECIKKTAWIIVTYHAIDEPSQFGFYYLTDMKKDFMEIKKRDFWLSSMNNITLYIKERDKTSTKIIWEKNNYGLVDSIKVDLENNLPLDIYNQPLTLLFQIPAYWAEKNIFLINNKKEEQLKFYSTKAMISIPPKNSDYYLILSN